MVRPTEVVRRFMPEACRGQLSGGVALKVTVPLLFVIYLAIMLLMTVVVIIVTSDVLTVVLIATIEHD